MLGKLGEDMGQYNMGDMPILGCELDNMETVAINIELVSEMGDVLGCETGKDMGDVLGCELGKWKTP